VTKGYQYYTVVRWWMHATLSVDCSVRYTAYKGKLKRAKIPKHIVAEATDLLEVVSTSVSEARVNGTAQIRAARQHRGLYDAELPAASDLKLFGWKHVDAGKPPTRALYPEHRGVTVKKGRHVLKNRRILTNRKQIFGYLSGNKGEKKLNSPQGIRRAYPKYPSPRWFYTSEGTVGTSSKSVPE